MDNTYVVEKFLTEELNLSKKEISIYINLIKYGPLTILELSEISGINRATTHVNVDYLTKKNLVNQVRKGRGSRRLIIAEPLEKLPLIFTERKAKLEAAQNQLGFIIKELSSFRNESKKEDNLEIRRFTGKGEVRLIYEDIIRAKEIRAFVNCEQLCKIFPGNVAKFLEAHKKRKDMTVWEIMEDSKKAREYAKLMPPERYYYRLTTKKMNLSVVDYLMFDGKVAIIDFSDEVLGVVIENDNFYENSKAIHKFVWQFLPQN